MMMLLQYVSSIASQINFQKLRHEPFFKAINSCGTPVQQSLLVKPSYNSKFYDVYLIIAWMPEWSKGPDSSSGSYDCVGSTPTSCKCSCNNSFAIFFVTVFRWHAFALWLQCLHLRRMMFQSLDNI
jgi:hypothetical protein